MNWCFSQFFPMCVLLLVCYFWFRLGSKQGKIFSLFSVYQCRFANPPPTKIKISGWIWWKPIFFSSNNLCYFLAIPQFRKIAVKYSVSKRQFYILLIEFSFLPLSLSNCRFILYFLELLLSMKIGFPFV